MEGQFRGDSGSQRGLPSQPSSKAQPQRRNRTNMAAMVRVGVLSDVMTKRKHQPQMATC